MSLSLNKALGILPAAMTLQAHRTELLASNIANADTPNYKSRDFDLRGLLKTLITDDDTLKMTTTRSNHLTLSEPTIDESPKLLYRIPAQPALDGNTVDPQLERAAFADNAMQYQSTLEFLNRRISGIRAALRKE